MLVGKEDGIQQSSTADNDVEQLRQIARDALLQGAQSGKLFDVLAESSKKEQGSKEATLQDVDQLRQQARNLLLEGAHSGKLQEVLQAAPQPESSQAADDVDKLRQQAREALLAGAQSGKLLEALAQKPKQEAENEDAGHAAEEDQATDANTDEIDALRQQALDLLLAGAQSGKLQEVLQGAPQPESGEAADDVDKLRQQAGEALLAGAQSGKLFDVLARTPKQAAEKEHMGQAAKEDQATDENTDEIDALRQQALDLLLEGAQSGKLQEVLQGAPQPESGEAADDVDKLRQQAREALLAGAQSGKLFEVLAQTQKQEAEKEDAGQAAKEDQATDENTDEIDALRQQALDLLLAGAQSGKLQEVLQGAPQPESGEAADDVDKLRQQAREALLAGAQSGKLFDVLAQTPKQAAEKEDMGQVAKKDQATDENTDEIDALRQQARDLLLEGAQSGKLQEVLQGAPQPESGEAADDVDKLRQQARAALLAGAQSGKLFDVLSANTGQTEQTNKPADDDMDDLRRQAREALLLGAQSGKLMELLAKNSEQKAASKRSSGNPDELELLRQQAREALIQGAQSGRLLEVLAKPDEAEEIFQLKKKLCEAMAGSMETGELTEALKQVHDVRTQEICQEASNALRDGAESGKVLQMLAEKAAGEEAGPSPWNVHGASRCLCCQCSENK